MKPLVATRNVRCASARDPLWLALADSDQLNRAIGNHRVTSTPISLGAARYLVKTRLAGLNLEYEELPFEWRRPEFLSITRRFRNGPARNYTFELRLADDPHQGTRVVSRIHVEPRWALLRPFVRANTSWIANRLVKAIQRIDANLAGGHQPYTAETPSVDHARLTRAQQVLHAALEAPEQEIGERLVAFVAEAPDHAVVRIRPFQLADSWQFDRRRVVAVCLEGVVAGLLELSWDIICPSCRTASSQLATLSDLKERSHCHLCDITVEVELDRSVEATFRPSTAIRPLGDGPYCIGGPFRTPHVVAQTHLPAGGTACLQAPEDAGRYRLFLRGGISASVDVADGAATAVDVTAGQTATPPEVMLAPGGQLAVHDVLNEDRHVKLEHLAWASMAATAHYLTTVDSFRRLFSTEVLRPGLRVKVTRVALLFTDLTASTALYSHCGDAVAYRFIQEHFSTLRAVINQHGGTLVKTIGDAVMAAFPDERSAAEAAIGLQRAYQSFASNHEEACDVQLRVGLFAGPSYLIHANKILDYFGQTVNIAARLQSESEGGQIVLPEKIAELGQASGWLAGTRIVGRFDAELKGITEPLAAVRLALTT